MIRGEKILDTQILKERDMIENFNYNFCHIDSHSVCSVRHTFKMIENPSVKVLIAL